MLMCNQHLFGERILFFFDRKHRLVNEFVTLTASKYDPLPMYCKHEDTNYGKGFAVFSIIRIKKRT